MNKRIDYNAILEINDDKGVINLLINIKFIVILVNKSPSFQNTSFFISLVFCETNIRDYQHKIEAYTDHYL